MYAALELVFLFLAVLFIVTQMLMPALTGGQYFWIFRKEQKAIKSKEAELSALREREKAIDLDSAIAAGKARLRQKAESVGQMKEAITEEEKGKIPEEEK